MFYVHYAAQKVMISTSCALILFIQTLALYKSFTYLLTKSINTLSTSSRTYTATARLLMTHKLTVYVMTYRLELLSEMLSVIPHLIL